MMFPGRKGNGRAGGNRLVEEKPRYLRYSSVQRATQRKPQACESTHGAVLHENGTRDSPTP